MPRIDVLPTVEACYRFDLTDGEWTRALCLASSPWLNAGLGVMAWSVDARAGQPIRVLDPVIVGGAADHLAQPALNTQALGDAEARRGYLTNGPVLTTTQVSLADPRSDPIGLWRSKGVRDFMALLGSSPDGFAILLGAPQPRLRRVHKHEHAWMSQVSAHLASAFRLRLSLQQRSTPLLASSEMEAILEPSGRVAHAAAPASGGSALAQLRRAVLDRDRARSSSARLDAQGRLGLWQGLVAGRWSLVDEFDSDQRRYVVALRNPPEATLIRGLSLRERQIVGYVALGWSNKATAYALGISESTAAAHLWRACRKLGVRHRSSLIQLVQRLGGTHAVAPDAAGPNAAGPNAAARSPDTCEPSVDSAGVSEDGGYLRPLHALLVELRDSAADVSQLGLSPVERQVLGALLDGSSYADIARQRCRSLSTVAKQVRSVLGKLGVSSRSELSARVVGIENECGT